MGKLSNKDKKNKIKNKKPKAKDTRTRLVDIQDAELLSKEQLKKIKQNRTCATRVSGKRKHKLLKRIRHQQKEKIRMDIESPAPETENKTSAKKDQSSNGMEVDS